MSKNKGFGGFLTKIKKKNKKKLEEKK